MKILNLGCGGKVSAHPSVINIDWSILLKIRANPVFNLLAPLLLNGERLKRFRALPRNIIVHDLAKGIPFPDMSADVVYHSHVLEHFDRDVAPFFISECFRVLKRGGLLRVVVPDFERLSRDYLAHVELCASNNSDAINKHDKSFEPLLLQSVRREASGTSTQRPLRRMIENLLLGDARRRGETHQWMYDRFNLTALLRRIGFGDVSIKSFDTSSILDWGIFCLDKDESGNEHKPGSLYAEASKA